MNDAKLPNGSVPLRKQRQSKYPVPIVPTCGPNTPRLLRKAFQHFNFQSEWEMGVWSDLALKALSGLLNHDEMTSVYGHLDKFLISEHEWPQLVIDCLLRPFEDVMANAIDEALVIKKEKEAYFQEVSSTAYKLFQLLYQNDPPTNSSLSQHLNNVPLSRELMQVVSLSTSATWPTLYHQWQSQADWRYFDDGNDERHQRHSVGLIAEVLQAEITWEDVEKVRIHEMPEFEQCVDQLKFPPPTLDSEVSLTSDSVSQRFIELALKRLDTLSEQSGRRFEDRRDGSKRVAHPTSYIFFNAAQWRSICCALFDVDPEDPTQFQEPTINKLLRKHYAHLKPGN